MKSNDSFKITMTHTANATQYFQWGHINTHTRTHTQISISLWLVGWQHGHPPSMMSEALCVGFFPERTRCSLMEFSISWSFFRAFR